MSTQTDHEKRLRYKNNKIELLRYVRRAMKIVRYCRTTISYDFYCLCDNESCTSFNRTTKGVRYTGWHKNKPLS